MEKGAGLRIRGGSGREKKERRLFAENRRFPRPDTGSADYGEHALTFREAKATLAQNKGLPDGGTARGAVV